MRLFLLAELTNPRSDGTKAAKLAGRLLELLAGEDRLCGRCSSNGPGMDLGVDEMDTAQRLDGPARDDFLEDRGVTWSDRLRAESRAEGLRAGRAEGRAEERRTLAHMAALKFGADTAGRLARLLADTNDERLLDVGGWIITCRSGNDLLAHVSKDTNGRE